MWDSESNSENRGRRWLGLNSKRLPLCLCVLLLEPDTESNCALSLVTHTHSHRQTLTHGHKRLSLFLACAGWCLAEEMKPNNRGICLSSRRVPPPHPHMTCPAFIHCAACCQPQDGPLPLPLADTPTPPPLSSNSASLYCQPLYSRVHVSPSSNKQEPSDMAASNIHNSHAATQSTLLASILRGNSQAVAGLNTTSVPRVNCFVHANCVHR